MKNIYFIKNKCKNQRIDLGIEYITKSLEQIGYDSISVIDLDEFVNYRNYDGHKIYVGTLENDSYISWLIEEELLIFHTKEPDSEGFYMESCPSDLTVICGGDDVGALYGCLELSERITKEEEMPRELAYGDSPVYKLRGPAVGLQKTKVEPPRLTYEYPITMERFPWFYDKELWTIFLDKLLKMRCNILYLWSGHPFSSLVKLKDYPEALEVSEEEFIKNQEIFKWLTRECERRGIWVVLKFYNIHISYPFAQKHGLDLLQSTIHPLVADYTSKSIKEFIKSYPNIGLMVCLGEALRGTANKTEWFIKTIIPAVKEGLEEAGIHKEPPIILRGHDCDPYGAMLEAQKIYSNLYTMWKYNGESLTTYFPKGKWQAIHQSLSGIGTTHIMNVHILADLEPFQFNAPLYIQKCVQAGTNRFGTNGLHLYPLFYWDWPYTPDKKEPRLLQMDRDYIWYQAWFRYAWNPNHDENTEKEYWGHVFEKQYGITYDAGRLLLDAFEAAGQCAPKILGRIGITEGNRQTLSLGMTMSQLTNVVRYRPNKELWYSVARKGEQPDDYIAKELKGEKHIGETPFDMIEEVTYQAERARSKFTKALNLIGESNDAINRIGKDIEAIYHMSMYFCLKIKAAIEILKYKYTMDQECKGDISLLNGAKVYWESSLDEYRLLTNITKDTYLYANSMQTPQRKIPFPNGETYGHWEQCLPEYEKEFENFKMHLSELSKGIYPGEQEEKIQVLPLKSANYSVLTKDIEEFELKKGNSVFTDCDMKLQNIAPELMNLKGIRMGLGKAIEGGVNIKLELMEDSYVLVGYMDGRGIEWLQLPDLETNTHADDRGGLTIVYQHAIKAEGCPVINVHAYRYEKGIHEIYFGTGGFVIAGIIPKSETMIPRNADLAGEGYDTLDWLYE